MSEAETSTITITRRHAYTDRLRAYAVVIDGVKRGTLRQGEVFRCAVSPGRHDVRLAIDWCGSRTLSLDVGSAGVTLSCAPNPKLPWLALFIVTFRTNDYIDLRIVA